MTDDSSLSQLAAIVRSSTDAILSTSVDGRVRTWNPAAERMFGYAASEMIGSPIARVLPADRAAEDADLRGRLARGERVAPFEAVRIAKGGRPIDVSVTLSPILDDQGRIVGVAEIARNAGRGRSGDRGAEARQKLLHVTLSSIGDAVLTTDNEARLTFMNSAAEALTGWSVADAIGRPLAEIFHIVNEHTRRPVESPVAGALRDSHIVSLDDQTLLLGKNGGEHPIEDSAAPIHDDRGHVFGAVLVFRDVTARRRHERDLLRLAAIVESSDDGIVTKTLAGIVTSWNPAAERIFGYTAGEAIGRPITFLFPPERLGEEAELLRRLARGERVQHFETERIKKGGQRIHVSVTLSPLKNDFGEVIGVSKIARDITERVSLLKGEQAARREAEAASRVKDEFLATLSHELRTPMNAIFGWTRMLRTGTLDAAATARALEVIDRNCRAQVDLISDLLDVSRIVTGRLTLESRPIDVRVPVRAAMQSVKQAAAAKAIQLDSAIEPDVPMVMGDGDRLQQVFWNLLVNAVKFTGRFGRITVGVRSARDSVEVTVADTGVGISPEVLPHVFERFRQADSSSSRAYGGLGIGLALVRHLVELQGGAVEAASEGEGTGACFTVRLPVRHPGTSAAVTPDPEIPAGAFPRLEDRRVLFVEDDTDARELVREVLERCGAVVTTAASTPAALLLLREDRPDVLISDIGMPGLDGYELIRRVRQMERDSGSTTPAIALTAYASAADRRRALESGYQLHISKPVDPLEVAMAVARLVRDA